MLSLEEILKSLKRYKEQKAKLYSIKKIGLFGSYAKNQATLKSDIDIVVEFYKPDLFNQIAIMQDLKEYFKKDVDVIAIWKGMNPRLKRRIDKEAIIIK